MKKSSAYYTAQILAASVAAAALYALIPREKRLRRGQVVVITGGSRGLGLALAHRFGRAGLKLVLAARSEDELTMARDSILRSRDVIDEDDILLVACDVTDPNQCGALIDQAIATFGQVDVLINNAGIIEVGAAEDQPVSTYEKVMAVNFFAALYLSYAVMPHMLTRRSGAIVNISSIGGKFAVPHLLPYSAAKFALTGFSEGLHAELRPKGVRVTTVCPGLMQTGGESHANFIGQAEKEKAWFQTSARTPLLSFKPAHAADKIFSAVNDGRAEITISPQAWLAARFNGLAPETTMWLNSLVNEYLLPSPVHRIPLAAQAHQHTDEDMVADPSPS